MEEKYLASFGKNIAEARRERGLTQEQLAAKVGTTRETIGLIERGQKWTRIVTLHQLAKVLKMTFDDLLKSGR